MRILLTNDDGIGAEGLEQIRLLLAAEHEVVVVAPAGSCSGSGHGITFGAPLRADRVDFPNDQEAYRVDGTPADCVKIALRVLLADRKPDLVVSGINHGSNAGINVLYSGTVAAAAEASLLGLPAIALSLERGGAISFAQAARMAQNVIGHLVKHGCHPGALYSVNIPNRAPQDIVGIRVTTQNQNPFPDESFDQRTDPAGRRYYWLQGKVEVDRENADNDTKALREGYISITPLKLDMTDPAAFELMNRWPLDGVL